MSLKWTFHKECCPNWYASNVFIFPESLKPADRENWLLPGLEEASFTWEASWSGYPNLLKKRKRVEVLDAYAINRAHRLKHRHHTRQNNREKVDFLKCRTTVKFFSFIIYLLSIMLDFHGFPFKHRHLHCAHVHTHTYTPLDISTSLLFKVKSGTNNLFKRNPLHVHI